MSSQDAVQAVKAKADGQGKAAGVASDDDEAEDFVPPQLTRSKGGKLPSPKFFAGLRGNDAEQEAAHREAMKADFMTNLDKFKGVHPGIAKADDRAAVGDALWSAFSGVMLGTKGMSKKGGEGAEAAMGEGANRVDTSWDEGSGRHNIDYGSTRPQHYDAEAAPAPRGGVLPEYKASMSEMFNVLTTSLKALAATQFAQAKDGFAFWNSPGAKEVAIKYEGLALESSLIGGLFDGLPGFTDDLAGWNPNLWAELSRAYASMVIDAVVKNPKMRIVVMCGVGFDNPSYNIWANVESHTLKLGAARHGMQEALEAKTQYFAVAGKWVGKSLDIDWNRSADGMVKGTHAVSSKPADIVKAQQDYQHRPLARSKGQRNLDTSGASD